MKTFSWFKFRDWLKGTAPGLNLVFKKPFDLLCLLIDRVLKSRNLRSNLCSFGYSIYALVLVIPGPAGRKN